jgi:hypothetical protein
VAAIGEGQQVDNAFAFEICSSNTHTRAHPNKQQMQRFEQTFGGDKASRPLQFT